MLLCRRLRRSVASCMRLFRWLGDVFSWTALMATGMSCSMPSRPLST